MIKKEGWEKNYLPEIANISTGKWDANHATENGKFRFYTCAYDYQYCDTKRFSGECIILPGNGANVGEVFYYNGNFDAYQRTYVISDIKILPKYLKYHMLLHWRALGTKQQYGAATNFIKIGNFQNYLVGYPSNSIQKRIVYELDLLDDIITKKKQQLADLDALAQATFYDMFGDPVSNEKGWKNGFLKEHTIKIGSGATPSGGNQNYKSEGISLIRSLNVHNGKFLYKDLAYIDDIQAKQLNNVNIQENDVLINITGASVARSCIVPNDVLPARVNQHVSIIRLKSNLNYVFINSLFISHSFQEKLLALGKSNGATREAITKFQLEKLEIPIPPISIQERFAQKIKIIEKQKQLINQSIADVQQLFDYTMDKYFN